MAYTSWDNQMTQYGGYFGTLDQVLTVCPAARTLLQNGTTSDAIITQMMDTAKFDLKERVMLRCQNVFPQQIAKYKYNWDKTQQRFFNAFYPAGFPNVFGYITIFGTFVDLNSYGYTDEPAVFVTYGTPTANLFNGTALNGAFLWDTKHQIMYIQRGTDTVVDWQIFDPSDLINFMVNPSALSKAFLYGTAYYIYENISSRVLANNQIVNLEINAAQEARFEAKYNEYASRAMSMLDIDISNFGIITSQDIKFQTANDWAAV